MNRVLGKQILSSVFRRSTKNLQKSSLLYLPLTSSLITSTNYCQIRRFHGDHKNCDHKEHEDCETNEHSIEQENVSAHTKEQLQMFDEFKEALDYEKKGNKTMALDRFTRVRDILKSVNQEHSFNYIYILKKIALLSLDMYQYKDAEDALSMSLDIAQEITNNPQIINTHYHNLFCFYLKANLKSAIMMGKAQMSEEEKDNIPIVYQKQFLYNLGTAYLLNGNYADAKKVLRSCLNMQPKGILKANCLNNLAVAYWWHKVPSHDFLDNKQNHEVNADYSSEDINKEFGMVVSQLKKSIEESETANPDFIMRDEYAQRRFVELTYESELVPENTDAWVAGAAPNEKLLQNPQSIKALLNIVDFIMSTGEAPANATFWLKFGQTLAEDLPNIDKASLLMSIAQMSAQNNEIIKAEGLFLTCEDLLKHSICYERVSCQNLFSEMLDGIENRQSDVKSKIDTANKITKFLPYWSPRMSNLHIPDFI